MDCFSSKQTWYTTKYTLAKLLSMDTIKNPVIVRQLQTLYDDLYQWSPDEPVCYGEFWSKLTNILWMLTKYQDKEFIDLLKGLAVNQSIPEEYRNIITTMLEMQNNK